MRGVSSLMARGLVGINRLDVEPFERRIHFCGSSFDLPQTRAHSDCEKNDNIRDSQDGTSEKHFNGSQKIPARGFSLGFGSLDSTPDLLLKSWRQGRLLFPLPQCYAEHFIIIALIVFHFKKRAVDEPLTRIEVTLFKAIDTLTSSQSSCSIFCKQASRPFPSATGDNF